jgi:hypothetical protein
VDDFARLTPVPDGFREPLGQSHLFVDSFQQQNASIGGLVGRGELHDERLLEKIRKLNSLSVSLGHGFPSRIAWNTLFSVDPGAIHVPDTVIS